MIGNTVRHLISICWRVVPRSSVERRITAADNAGAWYRFDANHRGGTAHDGTQASLCALLGLPAGKIEAIDDFGSDYLFHLKREADVPIEGTMWFWGEFGGSPAWDRAVVGRALILVFGDDHEPRPARMSIEEASQHIDFMRTDLVSISMEGSYAFAVADATPETRAAVERHNAAPEAQATLA